MTKKVTLVGGGLAGSLLSILLARRGYEIHLYERRADMRTGHYEGGRSINLALSTRGIRALEKVGLAKEVLQISMPMQGRLMHPILGDLSFQPYGKSGEAINSVSRGLLNIKLLQLADQYENIHMYFEQTCTHCDLENNITTFKNKNGELIHDKSDYIIATDGAYSAVRDAFQKHGRFNYSQQYEAHGYKELDMQSVNNGFAMREDCLHIWPRKSFMMIALPNPDKTFTCTLFMPFAGEPGFDDLTNKESIKLFFETQFPDIPALIPNYNEQFKQNPIGSLVTIRSSPWVVNKTALLGDSAHAIVPFYGQGMNCAFEDCIVMDELLEKNNGDFQKMLHEYEIERKPNANAIADLALQNFVEMRDLVGSPEFLHRKKVEHDLSEMYPQHFTSQYELVTFRTSPYTHALNQGAKNNVLLDYIIQHNLEEKIKDSAFMLPIIKEKLA